MADNWGVERDIERGDESKDSHPSVLRGAGYRLMAVTRYLYRPLRPDRAQSSSCPVLRNRALEFAGFVALIVVLATLTTACGGGSVSESRSTAAEDVSSTAQTNPPISGSISSRSTFSQSSSSSQHAVPGVPSAAWQVYRDELDRQLVQAECIQCHISGGVAAYSRLKFSGNSLDNALTLTNYAVDGEQAQRILNKILGQDNHGGGVIVGLDDARYQALKKFLIELGVYSDAQALNFKFEDREKTLRRAALIFAGRLPNPEEIALATQSEQGLKTSIRQLMQGEGFKQFLIRGANDQLLTDAFFNGEFFNATNPFSGFYPELSNRRYDAYAQGDVSSFNRWYNAFHYSVIRAPLELVAHVVLNDRPYTEILTANYTIANPQAGEVYRSEDQWQKSDFSEDNIPRANQKFQTRPVTNTGQILMQPGHQQWVDSQLGVRVDQHGEYVAYPHAGILNERSFLERYPSSDTNRNRRRAKTIFKLFLGLDIELLADRSLTREALADKNNPTMYNAQCVVCHRMLDPVAGAFQNYDASGLYRSSWMGWDALPSSYKQSPDSGYVEGETWFNDMRAPGFDNRVISDPDQSLATLADWIVADDRFAQAAITFWWPAVMSENWVINPEQNATERQRALYQSQQRWLLETAKQFREGFGGGEPYRLPDLLLEMVVSPWFRAEHITLHEAQISTNTDNSFVAGARLLTPEELEQKVKSLLGFSWGERADFWDVDGRWSSLGNQYRVFYGGIDSIGITERAKAMNSLMANVAEMQAVNLACASVLLDVNREPKLSRLLRNQLRYISPMALSWQRIELAEPSRVSLSFEWQPGATTLRLSHLNADRIGPVVLADFHITLPATTDDGSNMSGSTASDRDAIINVSGLSVAAAATLSSEQGKPTGLSAGGYIVLESGYVDIDLNQLNIMPALKQAQFLKISLDVLTPLAWEEPAAIAVSLNSASTESKIPPGEQIIRQQMVELFSRTQGKNYALDSLEINAAFALFQDIWADLNQRETILSLKKSQHNYCDLTAEGLPALSTQDTSDPQRLLSAWSHMLTYFFTDFYFLHE